MNSSSISMINIHISHHDIARKNGSIMVICDTRKTIFTVVAKSSFHNQRKSNISKDENHSFPTLSPLISKLSNIITSYSTNLFNTSIPPSVDPKNMLTGNFAPVGETPPTECLVVEGEIPLSLNGAYIRNGPNPQHTPVGPYHLWSGDGMLHSIRLLNGRAIFCSRFVKTCKYEIEQEKGFPFIPNVISGFYSLNDIYNGVIGLGRAMLENINIVEAFGVANTSLAFFHGNIFALADGGMPYTIRLTKEGDLETLREYKFSSKAPININAHPKVDKATKEVFSFQLHIKYPYLTFFRCGPNGSNWESVPILSMKHICFLHDFAITKKHVIFFDTQVKVSLINLLRCKGIPVSYQATRASRIGILPRYAMSDSEMRWFPAPELNAFHILNGWEEDNHIVLITPTISSPDNLLYEIGKFHTSLEKLVLDTKTGDISRKTLSNRCLEMGSINPEYQGKKNRYVYMAIHESNVKLSGVVKIDLKLECEVASRYYGHGCFGGEALFVPNGDATDPQRDEDDGFLVSYVHNENTDESYFVVMDARSLEYVCKIKLPGRVPYGLHGLFVNDEQLNSL